ncbi:MAG: transposase [Rectinemataceae bacterium]|nr:transposase [Spirochaetaceae bacterium]
MRKPRQLLPGARYHVIARINRGEFLFRNEKFKELFLAILRRAKRKYRFAIETFCVMDSHVHLIIRPATGESLSRIMQWILSVFAQHYNRIHNLFGHVWCGRFKSYILHTDQQRLKAHAYIARNPVAAKMVPSICSYQYSAVSLILAGDFSLVERPPTEILLMYHALDSDPSLIAMAALWPETIEK